PINCSETADLAGHGTPDKVKTQRSVHTALAVETQTAFHGRAHRPVKRSGLVRDERLFLENSTARV
ncbi:hypothetical protein, partial [Nocardiopsis sp. NRRL B-16309]|uniref:hypothetical protein n=1 Tax=Nocardiopsis sp. NRRL B-16309 TaxID=1519494 RepID=UPI001E3FE4AF